VLLWGEEPPAGVMIPVFAAADSTEPVIVYGDLNGDGNINSTDFTMLKRAILGNPAPGTNLAAVI